MKKLISSALILLFATSLSFAKQPLESTSQPKTFDVGMYNVKNTMHLKVFIEKKSKKDLKIEIIDTNGKVLISQFVNKKEKKAGLDFDLNALKLGTYTIQMSNDSEVYTKNFELTEIEPVKTIKKIKI